MGKIKLGSPYAAPGEHRRDLVECIKDTPEYKVGDQFYYSFNIINKNNFKLVKENAAKLVGGKWIATECRKPKDPKDDLESSYNGVTLGVQSAKNKYLIQKIATTKIGADIGTRHWWYKNPESVSQYSSLAKNWKLVKVFKAE